MRERHKMFILVAALMQSCQIQEREKKTVCAALEILCCCLVVFDRFSTLQESLFGSSKVMNDSLFKHP